MAYARLLLLLLAAVPLAAGSESGFTRLGDACRASTDPADDCSESADPPVNCSQNYDVLTGLNESTCMMVCRYLLQHCHGIEYFSSGSGGRCEIWKVPIMRAKDVTGYDCYTSDDWSADGKDEELSFTFDIEMNGADAMAFSELLTNESYEAWRTSLMTGIKDGLVSFYDQLDTFTVEEADIMVMAVEGSDPPRVRVTLTPPTLMDLFKVYAYFRSSSDFKDGTPAGGKASGESAIQSVVDGATQVSGFLAPEGTITIAIENRMLQKAEMMSPSPSPSPADTSTDGAASTKCWAATALFLASWVASTQRGEAH